ncbi:hypothetical protein L7F22_051792 [Adiantum nelumboides]|nr:hypothetical protein [Adiantum nelumboides]
MHMMEDVPKDTLQVKYEDGLHPGLQAKLHTLTPSSLFEAISYTHDAKKEINSITRMIQPNQPRYQPTSFNNSWSTTLGATAKGILLILTTHHATANSLRHHTISPHRATPHLHTLLSIDIAQVMCKLNITVLHHRKITPPITHNHPRVVCHGCQRFGHAQVHNIEDDGNSTPTKEMLLIA